MADRCVIFFSDIAAVVDIINKRPSKHTALMVLLRDLVLSCLRHNILFRARHIPGLINYQPSCHVTAFHMWQKLVFLNLNTTPAKSHLTFYWQGRILKFSARLPLFCSILGFVEVGRVRFSVTLIFRLSLFINLTPKFRGV